MSSTYAGTPVYAPTLTLPSDADMGNASSVNVPFSTAADRTAYLKSQSDAANATLSALGMSQSMNFKFFPQANIQSGVWDPKFNVLWLAGLSGTTPQMRYAFVPGPVVTASASTDVISGIAAVSDVPTSIDVDTAGNVVMACATKYIYKYNPATNVAQVVQVTAGVTGSAPGLNAVIYDPPTGRFVWLAYNSATPVIQYSTDQGVTWSAQVNVAGTIGAGAFNKLATSKLGTTLYVRGLSTGATIGVYRSTNGGATWAGSISAITSTNITGGLYLMDLSYCPDAATWFIVTGGNSSVNSEVWASTDDGVTWTLRKLFTTGRIYRIASVGPLLVSVFSPYVQFGSNQMSFICVSTDFGFTWRNGGTNTTSTANGTSIGCRQGEGFVFALSNGPSDPLAGAYVGMRAGTVPLTSATFT